MNGVELGQVVVPLMAMQAEKPVGATPPQTPSLLAAGTSQYRCGGFDNCVGSARTVPEHAPP
jgi:hypothetical protein